MKKIGILTTIQGHKSIAEAIQKALVNDYQVVMFSEVDKLFYAYFIYYKYFPNLFGGPFIIGSQAPVLRMARKIMYRRYHQDVVAFDQKEKPDLFINTFWMYESVLENLAKTTHRPLINALADPKSLHPTSIGLPPALNLSFDEAASDRCHHFYPESECIAVGWFVRPEFEADYDQAKVRQELKLAPHNLTILFVTGSDGMGQVADVINQLHSPQPLTLIVACGRNQALFDRVVEIAKEVSQQSPNIKIEALPFTDQMEKYMQAADLVVGKAGPNMIFESVATLTPFMATSHIEGQETGNLEIVKEYQLGYVEEDRDKATELLNHILAHPAELKKFTPHLEKMKAANLAAKNQLKKIVAEKLK